MSKVLGNISVVGVLTLVSRFMGLARDVLFFSAFGASVYGEAFILAFTLPNLFRRMLGEGTLTSAFIPVYTETFKVNSQLHAFRLLNQVLSRLFAFLFVCTVFVCSLSFAASEFNWLSHSKWTDASFLNSIIFGYVLFVCGTAVLVGTLNTHGSFSAGGFSPIILNLSMISVLLYYTFNQNIELNSLSIYLCLSVLLAGLTQFFMPFWELRRKQNWNFRFDLNESPGLIRIKKIFWIGAIGAAVAQINILVSRLLAYSLDETGGVSYLFLSSRLIELPLGVFALSISTVLFPELAKSATLQNRGPFLKSFFYGFRLTLAITLPAAIGLGCLAEPILSVLFQWGKFGKEEVMIAADILIISVAGLPFYAISSFMVKAFHSEKNMKPPVKSAVFSLLVNILLSLLLMDSAGARGLALANVLAALIQTTYLIFHFNGFRMIHLTKKRPVFFFPIILSSLFMTAIVLVFDSWIVSEFNDLSNFMRLVILLPAGAFSYFIAITTLGFPEAKKMYDKLIGSF